MYRRFNLAAALLTVLAALSGSSELAHADSKVEPKPKAAAQQKAVSESAQAMPETTLINERIRQGWRDRQLTPSEPATDGEWCRRVYLDLIGRTPKLSETQAFLADRKADKKARLVERLLSSDYADEYARHASDVWTNLLVGRRVDNDRRGLVNREGLAEYLRGAFAANTPYDRLVVDLIAANGANKPGEEGFNGAVNFLLDNLQDNATPATAKTARIFLGMQVQCTQCHDHPFNTWKQEQFWGFNAFFRQARALRTFQDNRVESARLEDEDFAGEAGNPKTGEIYFERRNSTVVAVLEPTFIDGTKIKPSGYVDEVNRRDALARLVSQSPQLSRAIVNRVWAHLLGYGFTKPVDDMGPHNPPTHPELLDELAERFKESGYDLKRLVQWIVLSEPYSLSSKAGRHNRDDEPALGGKPAFSRFYIRQLRPEELYDSLVTTTTADGETAADEKQKWLAQFTINLGTDENDEATTFNGTIPQALMLMNGDLMDRAIEAKEGSFLYQVAMQEGNDRAKINDMYLSAFSRPPSREELNVAQQIWIGRQGNTLAALRDIWWALLNSNEFILNH